MLRCTGAGVSGGPLIEVPPARYVYPEYAASTVPQWGLQSFRPQKRIRIHMHRMRASIASLLRLFGDSQYAWPRIYFAQRGIR